jgi:hypothetical protein
MSPEWHNHAGTQHCHPRSITSPGTLEELVMLVQRAEAEHTTVRAVGAGHAWSDIALTDGHLVLPERLGGALLPLDDGALRPQAAGVRLVRVRAGTHLSQLNAELDAAGLALKNMGGYDAQTLAGVLSTSTHGSGLRFGPFPDVVRSLDLVVSGGRTVRVEPADGITDPARHDGWLIQDDDTFAAAICGLGTLGLIYSLVIEVREKFWLKEVRTLSTWEAERERLGPGGVLSEGDHYELFVNPYAQSGGTHRTLVTRRADRTDPVDVPPEDRRRNPLTELEARIPLTGSLLRLAARHFPRLLTWAFDGTLEAMVDSDYSNVSYRVFNIGEANHLPAVSMELAVPLADGAHVAAVDRIVEIAAAERSQGRFHTSPFALRFVAASRAYASMMYARDTMMIELILVTGTRGGNELLATYERELAVFGARPHWGQYNVATAEQVAALYPRWDAWRAVERQFNESGVFDSEFTRRVGI